MVTLIMPALAVRGAGHQLTRWAHLAKVNMGAKTLKIFLQQQKS